MATSLDICRVLKYTIAPGSPIINDSGNLVVGPLPDPANVGTILQVLINITNFNVGAGGTQWNGGNLNYILGRYPDMAHGAFPAASHPGAGGGDFAYILGNYPSGVKYCFGFAAGGTFNPGFDYLVFTNPNIL